MIRHLFKHPWPYSRWAQGCLMCRRRLGFSLRDVIATELSGWIIEHIASKEFNERYRRVLATGDPEERVPAPEVVRR